MQSTQFSPVTPPEKKVVVDATWSTDQPSPELLESIRQSDSGSLPAESSQLGQPEPISPASASQPPSQGKYQEPTWDSPALQLTQRQFVELPMTPAADPQLPANGSEPIRAFREQESSLQQAVHHAGEFPQEHDATTQSAAAEQPRSRRQIEADVNELRVKAIVMGARGRSVAYLTVPEIGSILVREGERLDLLGSKEPVVVTIRSIADSKVYLDVNGQQKVIVLQ